MPPRKQVTPTKASESVVSRMLAKHLKVQPPEDTIRATTTAYFQVDQIGDLPWIIGNIIHLYPWVTNVANDIMNPRTTPLTEHLMSFPGVPYIVKDNAFSGIDSLWIAVGDPSGTLERSLVRQPYRGLMHNFRIGEDDICRVIAIQISSFQL